MACFSVLTVVSKSERGHGAAEYFWLSPYSPSTGANSRDGCNGGRKALPVPLLRRSNTSIMMIHIQSEMYVVPSRIFRRSAASHLYQLLRGSSIGGGLESELHRLILPPIPFQVGSFGQENRAGVLGQSPKPIKAKSNGGYSQTIDEKEKVVVSSVEWRGHMRWDFSTVVLYQSLDLA